MRCSSCEFENSDEMKYCVKCSTPLNQRCTKCGFSNPPESSFCGQCATSLTKKQEEETGEVPSEAGRVTPEGERRQLTVMFCDIVGSTPLSEQLDPEELREVIHDYQKVCSDLITRFEGHIAKYLGDGILVYFGYPLAHEDDAWRAVNTGLEIVKEMRELSDQLNRDEGISLNLRLGIHTGLVVVGEMGAGKTREPMAIVGDTPNIAKRLQEIAQPNTVVISTATYRLIEGYFNCKSLGLNTLKGISHPLEVYQVLHESGVRDRLDITAPKGLTPLVGREKEVELLLERWEHVREGEGQVVLVGGEAGIGKSRLLQVLKERLQGESYVRIQYRCLPYFQNTPFYPIINHLQRVLEFKSEDSPEDKLKKLESFLEKNEISDEEILPLFVSLLSIPLPDRYPSPTLAPTIPQKQKQKTQEALLTLLLKEGEKNPILFIVEDLHWVDPSTLEFLGLLVDQGPTARMLSLLTFRPPFHPPWAARSHLNTITLTRFVSKQVELMIQGLASGKAMPGEVVQQVVSKTDGVPLFVEELTKMVLESGMLEESEEKYELTGPIPPLAIPSTLQDSLMARLDHLSTVKEVAQLGATVGRTFTYKLLQAISTLDEESLHREIARLVEAELLYQRGVIPEARYIFKHALIQEAAYQSLLKSKRKQYHNRIASVLEEQFPETAEAEPEVIAHHYTEAELFEQAIPYWQKAGEKAVQRSANVEAIRHLHKGLDLIKAMPETPELLQQELLLQHTLGVPLILTKGYGAQEVKKTYERTRDLCRVVGDTTQTYRALYGLWVYYLTRAELQASYKLAEQLMDLAQRSNEIDLTVGAHLMLGMNLSFLGEFKSARHHLERTISLYNRDEHYHYAHLYGQDTGVLGLVYMAFTLSFLGYADQALEKSKEALALAKELSHPHSLAFALYCAAALRQARLETTKTQELANELITISTEQGFPYWLGLGKVLNGWVIAEQVNREEGLIQMRMGLINYRATGAEVGVSYFNTLLLETYKKEGRAEEGLKLLNQTMATVDRGAERNSEAELYRLKGELLLSLYAENQAEAETCFRHAIDVARHQSARLFQLRAIVSLSRLLQKQGKKEKAREMLSEIYSWFTEGFDTVDLKDAKALLEEL